jgi:hypothetical protein
MMGELLWSEACERNQGPILQALCEVRMAPGLVLEIGAGTGQHAVHFATALPHLTWLPSDVPEALPSLRARCLASGLANLCAPVSLRIQQEEWPHPELTHVYSANTAHIMSWQGVESVFQGVGSRLPAQGRFCLYGPFHEHGQPTSEGNRQFDRMLRARDPDSGIRDIAALEALAAQCGLMLLRQYAMPANNQVLVWGRGGSEFNGIA